MGAKRKEINTESNVKIPSLNKREKEKKTPAGQSKMAKGGGAPITFYSLGGEKDIPSTWPRGEVKSTLTTVKGRKEGKKGARQSRPNSGGSPLTPGTYKIYSDQRKRGRYGQHNLGLAVGRGGKEGVLSPNSRAKRSSPLSLRCREEKKKKGVCPFTSRLKKGKKKKRER